MLFGRKKRRDHRIEPGRDFPTPKDVKRLIAAVATTISRHGQSVDAAFTGLRASELRGLRWKDIDFKASRLHVRQRADRYNRLGAPKSDSSARTVPVDETTLDALRAWRLKSAHSKPESIVFCTRTGHVTSHDKLLDAMSAVMKTAKLVDSDGSARYGLHALRHFFASWCINPATSGGRELSAKEVQQLLGHATISMTLDLYGHLFADKGDRTELNDAVRQLLA